MLWDVALLPSLLPDSLQGKTVIVVDVLRASTTICVMLARGAREIVVAETPIMARDWAAQEPGWKLAGEEQTVKIPGFDYGNSPAEIAAISLAGERIILTTSNGTRALRRSQTAAQVLIGGLVNRTAVARAAERTGQDVVVVCAGRGNGTELALEDVYAAGQICRAAPSGTTMGDGAEIALACAAQFRDPLSAFEASAHGRRLLELGFQEDLELCAALDRLSFTPALHLDARWPVIRPA